MKLNRKSIFIGILCVLTIVFMECRKNGDRMPLNQERPQTPQMTLTLGTFTKSMAHAPLYAALYFNWFKEEPQLNGVKIKYKDYNDRPTISQAFSSKNLDVLFSAEIPQILCKAQGDDIRIVMLTTWATQEILIQINIQATSFVDLRGRKMALLAGTSSHYAILKLLEANKITQSDIALKFMNPPEAKTAFETKQIDAWAVWAPWIEQQTVAGRGKTLPGGEHIISIVMAYHGDLIANPSKKAAAKGIATVILRAKKWVIENPQEAQNITAQEIGLPIDVVKAAWVKQHWDARLDEDKIEDLQKKATFLAEAGLTREGKKLDVRIDLIDLSIIRSIEK